MSFTLPKLPYANDALAPLISTETLEFHYGKHHQAYVNNLNKLIAGTKLENSTLEEIIKNSTGGIFNNASQHWNHSFYWECLSPKKNSQPTAKLISTINDAFGSLDNFKSKFTEAATTLFGSGWAWLVSDNKGKLSIVSTSNADNPIAKQQNPLLTCDVWEHAYYIDYRNNRAKYVEAFWQIVNWDFVSKNFQK